MKPIVLFGAITIGTASLLSLGVLPIILGGLNEVGRLSKPGIGQAAMFELFGLAFGSAVGGYWMAHGAMRLKTGLAALGLLLINVATAHAGSETTILIDRAIAGLLGGLLFGAANAVIVRTANPDRLTGILVGVSMMPQIALAYLIPVVLIPRLGIEAGLYTLAAGGMVAAVFAATLVEKLDVLERPDRKPIPLSAPLVMFCLGTVLQSGGLGAAWTYIERVANQHGFNASIVGLAFSASLASQVVAAWLSAWLVPKIARWPTLLSLALGQGAFIAIAVLTGTPSTFIVAVCVFTSAAAAAQAFQMAGVVALDTTRRAAVLILPMILFGNGFGPLVASFAATEADVVAGCWTAVAMTTASLLLYLTCASLSRQRSAPRLGANPTLGG